MLREVVTTLKPSTCTLDPIPTSFFKNVFNSMWDEVLFIFNLSMQFNATAVVKPLFLKKSSLDPSKPSNYRPISNLPFLSKILEKLVYIQLVNFINSNSKLEMHQSGFQANHSIETALVKVTNDIRIHPDGNKPTVLVLLDLSAAFDTVGHKILLNRLVMLHISCMWRVF